MAQLLDIGFAGRIIYSGGSLGEYGGHDNVGRAGYRSLVEQHVAALEVLRLYVEHVALLIVDKLGTQFVKADEVGVKPATPYLVAARLGWPYLPNSGPMVSTEPRSEAHLRTNSSLAKYSRLSV